MSDAETVAYGTLLARVEHEWECDAVTIMQGPCNCNRRALVDELRAQIEARIKREASALNAAVAKLREGLDAFDGMEDLALVWADAPLGYHLKFKSLQGLRIGDLRVIASSLYGVTQ